MNPRVLARIVAILMLCAAPRALAAQAAGVQSPSLAPPATLQDIAGRLERDDIAGAKAATESALREHPGDPALHNFAGVIAAQSGAPDEAESQFQAAIKLAPRDGAAYENLGRLYQERSGLDPAARSKALTVYQQLLTVDPANNEALFQTSLLLAIQGKFTESRAALDRLPIDIRGRPQTLALLAIDLAGAGELTAAKGTVATLLSHPDLTAPDLMVLAPAFGHLKDDSVVQQALETLVARGMATPDVLVALGQLHMRHQRYADARVVLERAVAATPDSVPLLVEVARAVDKTGDHERALGYLGHARTLAPDDVTVQFLYGVVCVELNLGGEAYEALKRAVTLAPEQPDINYMMGAVSLHRHDPSEALPYFEKYVHLRPDDVRGRFARGVAKFTSNDLEGARADLSAIANRPETAAGAHYFLARIARQTNSLDEARTQIDSSIQAKPDYADAWAELGLIQTRTGDLTAADQSLHKALSIDPENYQATVNLTALYQKTRDARLAEQSARLEALQQKRADRAQDFLRLVQVVPE